MKKKTAIAQAEPEYIFIFKNVPLKCTLDPRIYSEDDLKEMLETVDGACREIIIDKSYVEFEGNWHKNTFLAEAGWNSLKRAIEKSGFGKKKIPAKDKAVLVAAYQKMITEYMRSFMFDLGYDVDGMAFELKDGRPFEVEYILDESREWEMQAKWAKAGGL